MMTVDEVLKLDTHYDVKAIMLTEIYEKYQTKTLVIENGEERLVEGLTDDAPEEAKRAFEEKYKLYDSPDYEPIR